MTNHYENKGYTTAELKMNNGTQYSWNKDDVPLICMNVYDSKDKFMMQPGQRDENNLLEWVRGFYLLKKTICSASYSKLDSKATTSENYSSPIHVIQSIAKSLGKAGKELAAKASGMRRSLPKSDSSGSIQGMLQAGQGTPQHTQGHSTNISLSSPMVTLTPKQDIFSPAASDASGDSFESDTKQETDTMMPKNDYSLRRSQRLKVNPLPATSKSKQRKEANNNRKNKGKGTGKSNKVSPPKEPSPSPLPPNPDPVRCCLCMEWFHAPEEEIYGGSVWTCKTCRSLPVMVSDIKDKLAAAFQTNADLVKHLASRIADNEELRKENHELRQLLNRPKPQEGKGRHLLITDSTLENIKAVDADALEIVHEPAVTFKDCQQLLSKKSKHSYDKVTLVVGRTDCSGSSTIEHLSNNLTVAIQQAKALSPSGSVEVSSILPQADNTAKQQRLEQMNSSIENICTNLDTVFINNDPSFRLGDGEINEGFLQDDGFAPNKAGKNKLLKNLNLLKQVSISTQQAWKPVTQTKTRPLIKQVAPNKKAPCWNCGEHNHTSNICRYKRRLSCHTCGKQGHKSSLCSNH
jgi:regulator of replication initiation timing